MSDLTSKLRTLANSTGFQVLAHHEIPARASILEPHPSALNPRVAQFVAASHPGGLYRHQVSAISAVLSGNDICLATSTASGKSLVFMAAAAHLLLEDGRRRVLAIYPAKALIQDQLRRWREFLSPFGLRVGFIDGSVPTQERLKVLADDPVVLMTPDVVHAWMMGSLAQGGVRSFLAQLALVVLDEAHVYEGVFGTNMAYLLRRLQMVSGAHQVICSTATLGRPAGFLELLTGRRPQAFDLDMDGSPSPDRTILVVRHPSKKPFDATVRLLDELARSKIGRFIAFGDSRELVEQLVAAVHRMRQPDPPDDDSSGAPKEPGALTRSCLAE